MRSSTVEVLATLNSACLQMLFMKCLLPSSTCPPEQAYMFQHNKFLRYVDLNNNNFKVGVLGDSQRKDTTGRLTILLPHACTRQDSGMAHFVQCIGGMYLHSLDLSFNQITPTMDKDILQRIAEKGGDVTGKKCASIPGSFLCVKGKGNFFVCL